MISCSTSMPHLGSSPLDSDVLAHSPSRAANSCTRGLGLIKLGSGYKAELAAEGVGRLGDSDNKAHG